MLKGDGFLTHTSIVAHILLFVNTIYAKLCKSRENYLRFSSEVLFLWYNVTMSKILIVGNVLKDVYLKLDERGGDFETDDLGINWLELGFNGEAHKFFHRTSVFGGAAVSLSVLHQLGLEASILNSNAEVKASEITWSNDPADYRYIFSYKGGITYFVPSSRKATDWSMPSGTPEWLLVDRSTNVSARLVDEIKNFLKFSHGTKLAVHVEKHPTPAGQRLAEMADILFQEDEPPVHVEEKIVDKIELDRPNTQLVCHISPRRISLGEAEESWSLDRADMMTHLTVYSTIVATVLGVITAGGSPATALLWARLNAEQSTLDGALSAEALQNLAKAELEKRANLKLIARSLMASGKGILAIDESSKALGKRLEKFNIANTAENRRTFYQMMATTPSLQQSVSGVILSDENAKQKLPNGRSILEQTVNLGIIPGIKADRGLAVMKNSEDKLTVGLDDLSERLHKYYEDGFRFAKWRAEFKISDKQPNYIAIQENATALASFAKECQLAGLVPVIDVDVLADGDHSLEQAMDVTARILKEVFRRIDERRIDPEGCILKCNMISAGRATGATAPSDVGIATVAILKHSVPKYLAGVWLLSGGTEPKQATQNLTAVMQNSPFPWPVTFAFSRALEEPVLATWKGDNANIKAAQAALTRHLLANVDALHYGQVEPRGGAGLQNIGVLDLG